MTPRDCPKFHKCNAPICPLDKNWRMRASYKNDAICFYLLESVKEGAKTRFDEAKLGDIYQKIISVINPICEQMGRVKNKVEAARNNKTKMFGNPNLNSKKKNG